MTEQQQQERVFDPAKLLSVETVVGRLQAGGAADIRKAREIKMLQDRIRGPWHGLVELYGFQPSVDRETAERLQLNPPEFVWKDEQSRPPRAIAAILSLNTPGLVWNGEQPMPAQQPFLLAIVVPYYYPKVRPTAKFLGSAIPWCAHVIHPRFLPPDRSLPPELQEMLRIEGAGHCCYGRASDWTEEPEPCGDLCVILHGISSIISLARYWGEAGTLNRAALKWTERHGKPIGPSLPYPVIGGAGAPAEPSAPGETGEQEDDFEWVTDETGQEGGNDNAA